MVAPRRAPHFDLLDAAAQRAIFPHELRHHADSTAESDHGENGLVAVDLGVDFGAGALLLELGIDSFALDSPPRQDHG
jgi:hypothetical protein